MKKTTKGLLVLGITSLLAITGCTKADPWDPTKNVAGRHTYRTYMSTKPKTWNVHDWETSDESYVPAFCEMGLYDLEFNEAKDGYVIVTEMASELPIDISSELEDEDYEKYGYKTNVDQGFVWQIKLNEDAQFASGKAITAKTYVESMKRLLDPKMANYRADGYYSGSLQIANAEMYYKQGKETIEPILDYLNLDTGKITDPNAFNDGKYYFNISHASPFASHVFSGTTGDESFYTVLNNRSGSAGESAELAAKRITDCAQYYAWKYRVSDGDYKDKWDEITDYSKLDNIKEEMLDMFIELEELDNNEVLVRKSIDKDYENTEENAEVYSSAKFIADLKTFCGAIINGKRDFSWQMPLFVNYYNDYAMEWENVGIKEVDDYTFNLYLKQDVTELDLEFSLMSNWIVNVELYDKLKSRNSSGNVVTTYASPAGGINGYDSYGPYKLYKFESGKFYYMVKNEKWYGWTDGKHDGQFQTDAIYTTVIEDHKVARQEFEAGNLDDLDLNRADMKDYGNSTRKTSVYESYTQKISFNSEFNKLKGRQGNGSKGNKTILSNLNFRKGLSLAMDRNNFAAQATSGSKAFTGLLNDLYLTDIASGEMYRNTEQGKSVYNMVYGELGGDPFANDYTKQPLAESENGYNIAMATKYVIDGIKEELLNPAEGSLRLDSKNAATIGLEFLVYDTESETTKEMLDFIRGQFKKVVDAANEKEGWNITIKIDAKKDEQYYDSAKSGNYDMIFSIWGGAAINPVGLMEVYCKVDFESTCEYGFKGKQDKEDLSIDTNHDGVIGSGETKSFHAWWTEINEMSETGDRDSSEYKQKHDYILTVLSHLEAGIINRFEAIPLVARATTSLNSFKIENGAKSYVNLIGYGGIRYLTYNYDDVEWAAFKKDNDNNLSDLYK